MPRVRIVQKARKSKKQRTCQTCGKEIEVGEPYRWAKARRGFTRRYSVYYYWCKDHRPAKHFFVANEKQKALYEAQDGFNDALGEEFESSIAEDAFVTLGDAIADIAEMMREHAENIRGGFGHDTWQSYEFDERADTAERVADELRNIDLPEEPDGDYTNYADEEEEEAWETWREEVRQLGEEKLGEVEI